MFFSKSLTFEQEELQTVAVATESSFVDFQEAEFIEKLKAGDEEAFDTLVSSYISDIYSLLYRLTSNPEDAQDLTQETFLRALKAIKNFRGEANLKTWLFRIAINESRNNWRWWKRRHKSSTVSLDSENNPNEIPLAEKLSHQGANPEDETLFKERAELLEKALRNLSDKYREVVVLRDIEGLSYEEISDFLQTNIGTIKSRLARAREELRRNFNGF